MSTNPEKSSTDLSELIAENFGANATYVETLLARFRSDPALVDESWRAYFAELLGDGVAVESTAALPKPHDDRAAMSSDGKAAAATARAATPAEPKVAPSESVEAMPIRGPA